MNQLDRLALQYDGNTAQADKIIRLCDPYISQILKKVPTPAVSTYSFDDVIQEARIAAFEALGNFDPDKGSRFSTYMYIRVWGTIHSFIRKHDPLSRQQRKKSGEIRGLAHTLEQDLGYTPSAQELAKYAERRGITNVESVLMAENGRHSVDPHDEAYEHELPIDRSLEAKFDVEFLMNQMEKLTVKERVLLFSMYWLDLDGRECAILLGYANRRYIYRLKQKLIDELK